MKKFEVVEQYTEYVIKTYIVEAEDEDQARQMVEDGEIAEDDYETYIDTIDTSVKEI